MPVTPGLVSLPVVGNAAVAPDRREQLEVLVGAGSGQRRVQLGSQQFGEFGPDAVEAAHAVVLELL